MTERIEGTPPPSSNRQKSNFQSPTPSDGGFTGGGSSKKTPSESRGKSVVNTEVDFIQNERIRYNEDENSFGPKRLRLSAPRAYFIGPTIPVDGYGLSLVPALNDAGIPIAAPITYFDLGDDYIFNSKPRINDYEEDGGDTYDSLTLNPNIDRYDAYGKQLSDKTVEASILDQLSESNQKDPDAKNLAIVTHLVLKQDTNSNSVYQKLHQSLQNLITKHRVIKREFVPEKLGLIASYVEGLHVNKQRSLGDLVGHVFVNYQGRCWKVRNYGIFSNRFVSALETLKLKLYEFTDSTEKVQLIIENEELAILIAKYIECDMVLNFMTKSEGYRQIDPKTKMCNVYIQNVDQAFEKLVMSKYFQKL
jgi:hypothetical protein